VYDLVSRLGEGGRSADVSTAARLGRLPGACGSPSWWLPAGALARRLRCRDGIEQ